jgi:hypothetical protein
MSTGKSKQNISVTDIVSQLKEMRETCNIFIPSQGKHFKFKVLTTAQQKTLLKSLLEDSIMNTSFNTELNKIIVQNIVAEDGALDLEEINIYDRNVIAVGLRIASLGNIFKTENESGEEIELDLNKLQNSTEKIFPNIIVEEDDLKIMIGIPNILDDELFSSYTKFPKKSEIKVEDIGNYAIDAVYLKIAEHIVSIERPSKNKYFDMRQDVEASLAVIQNLPTKIWKNIYEKIEKEYIKPVNDYLELADNSIEIKSIFTLT